MAIYSDETDEEFDDGGTPMWRERIAEARIKPRRTIPAPHPAGCLLIGFLLPWVLAGIIAIGGLIYILIAEEISHLH